MADPAGVPPLVTFLSDFGSEDAFVGLCHAAVLARCPSARIVDLSHAVAPQDVAQGAARLADAVAGLPSPAVHLAVVDPGVGTQRRGLVLACGQSLLVGPDNGLLLPAADGLGGITGAWRLPVPEAASATFHGRDVFAPAAGDLAGGAEAASLGDAVDPDGLTTLRAPTSSIADGYVDSPVRDVDRFGNLQLSVRPAELARAGIAPGAALTVHARGWAVPARCVRTFADLEPGAIGILEDSFGWAAVVQRDGSAARDLDVGLHAPLTVEVGETGAPEGA